MAGALEVVGLTAHAAHHENGHLAVAEGAGCVAFHDGVPAGLVDLLATAGEVTAVLLLLVPVQKGGVGDGQPALGQGVHIGRGVGGVHRAGAGPAVDGGGGGGAEQGDLGAGQGQDAVVFQQHRALGLHLLGLCQAGGLQLGDGAKLGLVVAHILPRVLSHDLSGGGAQEAVDLPGELPGDAVAEEGHDEQAHGDVGENFLQKSFP